MLRGQATSGGASFRADVYSFGVVVWEIYTGKLPWKGMLPYQIMQVVAAEQRRLDILPTFPPSIKSLLAACWQHQPTLRPTMRKIMEDFPEAKEEEEEEEEEDKKEGAHPLASVLVESRPPCALSAQLAFSAATTQSASATSRCWIPSIAYGFGFRGRGQGSRSRFVTLPNEASHAW